MKNITPIVSPMLAHAKMLREIYGDSIKVIFAGPCIGKKSESDNFIDLVDVAITFKDLAEWLEAEGLNPAAWPAESSDTFVPYGSKSGSKGGSRLGRETLATG